MEKIDAQIKSLYQITDTIRSSIGETHETPSVFNLDKIEARANSICVLRHLYAELKKLTEAVGKIGQSADEAHNKEIVAAQEVLIRIQSRASKTASAAPAVAAPVAAPVAVPAAPIAEKAERRSVSISGNLKVDAIVLPSTLKTVQQIFSAINTTSLYYIPQWNHFAVKLGSCVLHANLGHIYYGQSRETARELPERIKECRRYQCKRDSDCHYYHDPETHENSKDVRNFMANSWTYLPTTNSAQYGMRRIGSLSNIETDILSIGVEEAKRFLHQTAHDIVCSAILWQHVIAPARRQKK